MLLAPARTQRWPRCGPPLRSTYDDMGLQAPIYAAVRYAIPTRLHGPAHRHPRREPGRGDRPISRSKQPSHLSDWLQGQPTKYTLVGFMRTRGAEFWWTQGLLAAGVGVSRQTVGRWLRQLERAGIVERRRARAGRTHFLYGLRPYFRNRPVPLRMNNGHQ